MAVISSVDIEVAMRGGRSVLVKGYATHPYKIADITDRRATAVTQLMLMNSSPGFLSGDCSTINIGLGELAGLELTTQSYQRLFPMKQGATQRMNITLSPGSTFTYLPHPVVPHHMSDFKAINKIYLTAGCSFLWGEVLTCGRKLNDEVFRLTRYHALTEIYLCSKMVIRENLLLLPALIDSTGFGLLEGFTHQATLIYLNKEAGVKALVKEWDTWIKSQTGIMGGVTAAPVDGIIVRLLGHKAEQLFDSLTVMASRLNRRPVL